MKRLRLPTGGARSTVTNTVDQSRITQLHERGPRPRNTTRQWYRIIDLDRGIGTAEVFVYDEIGFWGVSAAEFVRELEALEAVKIDLRINSPGGDVFDGIAIYNALCNHPAVVTTYVDGLAASAASFIAQAGAKVLVARNATMMIHDAEGICIGNAADMEEMAELLNRTSDNIADIYAQRCSTVGVWRKAMRNVSWYVGQEAVVAGLADEAYDPEPGDEDVPAERRRRATASNRKPRPVDLACPEHSTATTDEGDWDANSEQSKLDSPMAVDVAKKMYAYIDESREDEDGKVPKDACSLPHHVVGEGGAPGAAHMGGVRNAIARLSQSDIPQGEQGACRAHLDKHLTDGGGSPPEDDASDQVDSADTVPALEVDDISSWWNPEVFRVAIATAADQHQLYGFDPGMFQEVIRAVAEDFPAIRDPEPENRALPPAPPTITRNEFETAIRRGLM